MRLSALYLIAVLTVFKLANEGFTAPSVAMVFFTDTLFLQTLGQAPTFAVPRKHERVISRAPRSVHSEMSLSKGRGRPIPDASVSKNAKNIYQELERALAQESKFKSNLMVTHADEQPDAVALPSRDGAVQILRYLKVWFDLPSIVFITSVNIMDRFLSVMVVSRHLYKTILYHKN